MGSCIYLILPLLLLSKTWALSSTAPKVHPSRVSHVSKLISSAFGDADTTANDNDKSATVDRYTHARNAASILSLEIPQHELVYGELSVEVLSTILDAVGVRNDGEVFLDIGSGDGALVLGASLLYSKEEDTDNREMNPIRKAVGVEIVPGLVDRSKVHAKKLETLLQESSSDGIMYCLGENQAEVQFILGDVHQSESDEIISNILAETTLAVCFATTWSAGNNPKGSTSLNGRKLPKLSKALSKLNRGARVVIIDGRLNENDGFCWQGDLRVDCPDTAPYSIAFLYHRR